MSCRPFIKLLMYRKCQCFQVAFLNVPCQKGFAGKEYPLFEGNITSLSLVVNKDKKMCFAIMYVESVWLDNETVVISP